MKMKILLLLNVCAASSMFGSEQPKHSTAKEHLFTAYTQKEKNKLSFPECKKMSLLEAFKIDLTDNDPDLTSSDERQKLGLLKLIALRQPERKIFLRGLATTATFSIFSLLAAYKGHSKIALGLGGGAVLSGIGTTALILARPL